MNMNAGDRVVMWIVGTSVGVLVAMLVYAIVTGEFHD